jgi:hypothetical protein
MVTIVCLAESSDCYSTGTNLEDRLIMINLMQVANSYWLLEVLSSLLGVKTRPLCMVSVVFSSNMLL